MCNQPTALPPPCSKRRNSPVPPNACSGRSNRKTLCRRRLRLVYSSSKFPNRWVSQTWIYAVRYCFCSIFLPPPLLLPPFFVFFSSFLLHVHLPFRDQSIETVVQNASPTRQLQHTNNSPVPWVDLFFRRVVHVHNCFPQILGGKQTMTSWLGKPVGVSTMRD